MRIAALIGAILLIVIAVFQGKESPESWFAIHAIEIKGQLKYSSRDQLQKDYTSLLGKSLLTTSISQIKAVALSPQWVQSVEVRKVWPNTLQVVVHEHEPLAYWNDGQVITTGAVIISPKSIPNLPLPKLLGPEDSSDVVLKQFGLISQVLSLTSLRIDSLQLKPRGAWVIVFKNGIKVKLGREDILERLQRFIAVYKTDLSGRIDQISSVDARYPHGVAVAWKKQ
ncbi:Cell division protein FtsQ [Marinomonas spartinae]|uniref:Cell division protein FtsQ n=1 Tax=Marinomonas spartinae TaxID=1792290 RepID=A0A1A8TBL3_9GAMM|nr:cell division protein FtsQ/DivIB [Marinomonas spartinae]SBS30061.1 Cell division protein FtsQ [Marinomonas spartinae]SBS37012.1 Cell division protein FtsQ [Marinomonas spartinae]